jgi:hypothetical protein
MQLVMLFRLLEVGSRSELIATWKRTREEGHPERIGLPDIGPSTPGARCCRNPECAYASKWVRGTMVPNQDGKLICIGCYAVYEPREVIDAASEDFGRLVHP